MGGREETSYYFPLISVTSLFLKGLSLLPLPDDFQSTTVDSQGDSGPLFMRQDVSGRSSDTGQRLFLVGNLFRASGMALALQTFHDGKRNTSLNTYESPGVQPC